MHKKTNISRFASFAFFKLFSITCLFTLFQGNQLISRDQITRAPRFCSDFAANLVRSSFSLHPLVHGAWCQRKVKYVIRLCLPEAMRTHIQHVTLVGCFQICTKGTYEHTALIILIISGKIPSPNLFKTTLNAIISFVVQIPRWMDKHDGYPIKI